MNRPILLYTRQETIDLTATINKVPAFKQEAERYLAAYNAYEAANNQKLSTLEDIIIDLNRKLNEVKEGAGPGTGVGGYMQNVFKTFDIIVLNNPEALTDYDTGLLTLILGHEVGHSFFKSEMAKVLKNPLLRRALRKILNKQKKNLKNKDRLLISTLKKMGMKNF